MESYAKHILGPSSIDIDLMCFFTVFLRVAEFGD